MLQRLARTPETGIWVLLMTLSAVNWTVGGQGTNNATAVTVMLLCLAFFKARLVMRYFMEVRNATQELKISCEAWLIACFILVTSFNAGVFN